MMPFRRAPGPDIAPAHRAGRLLTPHRPKACQQAAGISGAATSASTFTVQADLRCAAPPGSQLFVVEQLLNEGKSGTVKHSEYYLAWDMKNTTGQQYFSDSPAGCVTRKYCIISVTSDQLTLLQQSPRTSSSSYYGNQSIRSWGSTLSPMSRQIILAIQHKTG
jgi:hypothetical protein